MRFGKNVLSQSLRTNCDLALYLTLFRPAELERAGLPGALDARPGVRSLRDAGVAQETLVYNRLQIALGVRCLGAPPRAEGERWRDEPLGDQLDRLTASPAVLVQPKFELARSGLDRMLQRLGVAQADLQLIPDFEGFIPDVILVQDASASTTLIDTNGDRVLVAAHDERMGLSVIDVKHAQEANPSYESEAVLYAVLLANWLAENEYADRFFVAADVFLWTRGGVARAALQQAIERDITDPATLIGAVRDELDPINLPMYVQAIRRFFAERIPTVVRQGNEDWTGLDWHVAPTCASCDWLGYQGWLSPRDRPRVAAHPEHYCFSRAAQSDHVSRLPLITRGSRRVLQATGINTVAQVAATTGNEDVYGYHTRLKSDRRSIPGFAVAIETNTAAVDADRADGMLARYADLDVFLAVNFDPGAGLLTGLGLRASFTQHFPFGQQPAERRRRRWHERWVVAAKSPEAERSTVLAFLQQLATIFEHVHDADPQRGGPHADETRTQIVFWDRRQFQELCLALGRHLPAILYDQQERLVRALAWIFPPEELQELDATIDDQRPAIAFVKDTVRRLVRVPAVHALTLFNVAEHYHYGDTPLNPPDHFYREPLSDTIPRERIYELWSLSAAGAVGVIRWGTTVKTYNQLIEAFSRTVDQQAIALASVAWRLRGDVGPRLKAEAPRLRLVVPTWATGVAHDAKLWIAWARFESAVGRASNHLVFMADPDEVEASNEGVRLVRELHRLPTGEVEYEVSADSLNTKLRVPGEYLCLSVDAVAGFLALPTWAVIPRDQMPHDLRWMVNVPMHKLFGARLEQLDRATCAATVSLADFWGRTATDMHRLRGLVMQHLAAEFAGTLTLVPGLGPDIVVERLQRILVDVGDPPIATPAPETLVALGAAGRRIRPGTDPVTPLAQVLWDGGTLHRAVARRQAAVEGIVACARERAALNESQSHAVEVAASRRLTVIWGPPGTGKTKTCAGLLHGLIAHEASQHRAAPYTVLVSGPTYKAVGELVDRLAHSLVADPAARCRLYTVYSPTRPDRFPVPAAVPDHFEIIETTSLRDDDAFLQMREDLQNAPMVIVVATVTHQCARIAEQFARIDDVRQSLWTLFDFALIDETSQVDMTTGVMPLALLKPTFQLVIAGDHLQMPPVVQAEPPLGAEHLVGSLQRYLSERFDVEPVPLLRNYRSHSDIVAYTRRLGYPPDLEAANPNTALAFVRDPVTLRAKLEATGLPWSAAWPSVLNPTRPIVGVTYPDGTAGQANAFEAGCVAAVVWLLRETSSRTLVGRPDSPAAPAPWDDQAFWTFGVGIVTPHRAQRAQVVRALIDAFPETDPALIENAVDTVERFQGGERHTILISFGVGDPDVIRGEERFLLHLERSNVAISRAMAKCVVFLSDEVANHIPDDRRAAATAHALRGIVDEWCVHRTTEVARFAETERALTIRWR